MAHSTVGKLKEVIGLLILLDKLLPVIGIAGLLGAAYGFWASLGAMRPEHLIPLVLVVMAATVLLISGVRAFLNPKSESLMVRGRRIWALSETFRIDDAAQILARSPEAASCRPYFRLLKERANAGKLMATEPYPNGKFGAASVITRDALIAISKELGVDDPFK